MNMRALGFLSLAVVAGCGGTSPTLTVAPTTEPSAAIRSEPAATPVEVADLDLSEWGWWQFVEGELHVGLLDGTVTARIPTDDLTPDPRTAVVFVRGPASHLVLYSWGAGHTVELHVVSVISGEDRPVGQASASVGDMELAPDGSAVYWVDSRLQPGLWRLDIGSGQQTRLTLPPVVARTGVVLAAAIQPRAQVAASADGRRVAALWCGLETCRLQLVDLTDGMVSTFAVGPIWVDLGGFAADGIELSGNCLQPGGRLVPASCERPDTVTTQRYIYRNFGLSAELPAGWTLGVRPVTDAPPMSFELDVVAIPADGTEPVILDVFGTVFGQG